MATAIIGTETLNKATIVYRAEKGSALTHDEMDGNFSGLAGDALTFKVLPAGTMQNNYGIRLSISALGFPSTDGDLFFLKMNWIEDNGTILNPHSYFSALSYTINDGTVFERFSLGDGGAFPSIVSDVQTGTPIGVLLEVTTGDAKVLYLEVEIIPIESDVGSSIKVDYFDAVVYQ